MRHSIKTEQGIIHYGGRDAVFLVDGVEVSMEFHPYCGPSFWVNYFNENAAEFEEWWENESLIQQYDKWWGEEGVLLYGES